jgi:predicted acylesterase/phospholipase RssA
MRYSLLYISTPTQMQQVVQALERMQANPSTKAPSSFELKNKLLGNIVLDITIVADIDGVCAYLRQHPADLLIYDERGSEALAALDAIELIRKDVRAMAELWGPDFVFPMSRVVAILREDTLRSPTERAFELGRLNVRDVCVAPKSISVLLLWLKRVLTQGVIRKNRVGIALSGGGIEGFLFQVGCLMGLDAALDGRSLNDSHVIAGVSSGSIAGSIYAAQVPLVEVIHAIHQRSKILPPLKSSVIFDLAGLELIKRLSKEGLVWAGINPQRWLEKVARMIPTGFFKGDGLEDFFRAAFEAMGLRDRFEDLRTQLFIGATDQDSFEHIIFGQEPYDKVPVSSAIRASIALPPFFVPKKINGRYFIDGQVTKTTDLELVIEKGCSLVIIINPLKPYPSTVPGTTDRKGGVFAMIQTVKALVTSRLQSSLSHLTERNPDVDFIVLEPDDECAKAMAGSPMRYRLRTEIIQLAYESTLRKLRERHAIYAMKLGRYGYQLRGPAELRELEKVVVSN